jgi:hypothetical protein
MCGFFRVSPGIRVKLAGLSIAVATMSGCVIHYQYQAKIIEIRFRKSDDLTKIWSRITTVVEALGYHSDPSLLETSLMSRRFSRPLRFFSSPSIIDVDLDEKSNVLYLKKIRVGRVKALPVGTSIPEYRRSETN